MTSLPDPKLPLILEAADKTKADDIVALDVRGLSSVTDFFVVMSGNSDTQVRAIADAIDEKLSKEIGVEPLGREGYNEGTWVLLDYVDLVIHVFHREKRVYYALEDLWSDAERLSLSGDEAGAADPPD